MRLDRRPIGLAKPELPSLGRPHIQRSITGVADPGKDLRIAPIEDLRNTRERLEPNVGKIPGPAQWEREVISGLSGDGRDQVVGGTKARIPTIGVDDSPIFEVRVTIATHDHEREPLWLGDPNGQFQIAQPPQFTYSVILGSALRWEYTLLTRRAPAVVAWP